MACMNYEIQYVFYNVEDLQRYNGIYTGFRYMRCQYTFKTLIYPG